MVGWWLQRERRTDVGRMEGMEEELRGKGDVGNFPGIPQHCETASAPSTFANVFVQMCACPWLRVHY